MRKLILLFLLIPSLLFGIDERVYNTSLYNVGLGGPHTGMAKGFDSFYNNPALLAEYDSEFSFINMDTNIKGDTFELLNLYLGGNIDLDDTEAFIDTLEDKGLTSLLIGLDFLGPLSIGKIGNNWGWALNNTSSIFLDVPSLLSTTDIIAREDLMFSAGVAIPFKVKIGTKNYLEITTGIMSRTTLRGEVYIDSDLIGLLGYSDDFSSILNDYPFYLSPIFAIDLGFIVNVFDIFKFSGVLKDLYTPVLKYKVTDFDDALNIFSSDEDTVGSLIERELNLGVSGSIPLGSLPYGPSDISLYLDYFDLLDFDTNFWLHWGAGVDIELLEKIHLLTGIYEGLLSLGLNIDVGALEIGFAMYGTEEGSQPGANSTFNFLFSTGISF